MCECVRVPVLVGAAGLMVGVLYQMGADVVINRHEGDVVTRIKVGAAQRTHLDARVCDMRCLVLCRADRTKPEATAPTCAWRCRALRLPSSRL